MQSRLWLRVMLLIYRAPSPGMAEITLSTAGNGGAVASLTCCASWQHAGPFPNLLFSAIGAGDPRCKLAIVMGVTNPDADRLHRHSMILVPMDTPGVRKIRPLTVFGYVGRSAILVVCIV